MAAVLRLSDIPESVSQLPPGCLGQTKPDWSPIVAWATSRNGPGTDSGSVRHSRHLHRLRSCHDRRPQRRAVLVPAPDSTARLPGKTAPTSRTTTRQRETAEGPGRTQPGILLVASPFPTAASTSPRSCYSAPQPPTVRLGPTPAGASRQPFSRAKPVASHVQVSAGDQPVMVPGSRVTQRVDLALTTARATYRAALPPEQDHRTQHPLACRPRVTAISPLVEGVPRRSPLQCWCAAAPCTTSRVP